MTRTCLVSLCETGTTASQDARCTALNDCDVLDPQRDRELQLLNQCKLTNKKWEAVTNPQALLGRHALQPSHPSSNLLGKRQLQAFLALQRGRLCRHVVEVEPVGRLEWEVLRLRLRGSRQQEAPAGDEGESYVFGHE